MAYKKYERKRVSRCSFCGGVGHNRSTCPELKAVIKQRLADDPDDIAANTLLAHEEAKKARRANTKRKCSFCGEQGHNRASCAHLKKEIEVIAELNIVYRKRFLDIMSRLQISEFLLATSARIHSGKGAESFEVPLLLKSIEWGNINYWNRHVVWPERHSIIFNFETLCLVEGWNGKPRRSKFHFSVFNDREMVELASGLEFKDGDRISNWHHKGNWPTVTSATGKQPQPPAEWLDAKAVKKEVKKYIKEVGLNVNNFYDGSYMRLNEIQESMLNIKDPLKQSDS